MFFAVWLFFCCGSLKQSTEKNVCTKHGFAGELSFTPDSLTLGSSRNSAGIAGSDSAADEATDNVAAAA